MAVSSTRSGALRPRENARPERLDTCDWGPGGGVGGGVALSAFSPLALLLSAPTLFATLFVSAPLLNLDGTMIGKLPTPGACFRAAASPGVEVEDVAFLGEVEFGTSAVVPDDWPKVSAATVKVKISAADSIDSVRRKLFIVFLPPND